MRIIYCTEDCACLITIISRWELASSPLMCHLTLEERDCISEGFLGFLWPERFVHHLRTKFISWLLCIKLKFQFSHFRTKVLLTYVSFIPASDNGLVAMTVPAPPTGSPIPSPLSLPSSFHTRRDPFSSKVRGMPWCSGTRCSWETM